MSLAQTCKSTSYLKGESFKAPIGQSKTFGLRNDQKKDLQQSRQNQLFFENNQLASLSIVNNHLLEFIHECIITPEKTDFNFSIPSYDFTTQSNDQSHKYNFYEPPVKRMNIYSGYHQQQAKEKQYQKKQKMNSKESGKDTRREEIPSIKTIQDRTKNIHKSNGQQSNEQSLEFSVPYDDDILNFFSTGNSPSAEVFHQFNTHLKEKDSDLSVLWRIWNSPNRFHLMESIDFIIKPDNWSLLKYDFKQPLQVFMTIYLTKIQGKPFYRQLYPGLHELMIRVNKIIAYRPLKRKIPNDPNSDLLYSHYLEEIVSINKREGAYFIRQDVKEQNQNSSSLPINEAKIKKIPIGEYIANSTFYDGKEGWEEMFFRASVHKTLQEDKKYEKDEQYQIDKKIRDHINLQLLTNNKNILQPSLTHLCCARYFFVNKPMYDKNLSICPVLLKRQFEKLNKSIDGNKDSKQLKETLMDICALLNSGGGVILFNVQKNYLHYEAKGEIITTPEFKKATQAIQKQLKKITPKVTMNQDIVVTFVPVAKNLQSIAVAGQPSTLIFIEGVYMMRIVVRPKQENAWKTYFLQNDEKFPFCGQVIKNQRTEINFSSGQFHRLMKRKFLHYYVSNSEQMDEEEINMFRKSSSYFSEHLKCSDPQKGLPLKARVQNQNHLPDKQLEKRYKYLTLLVAPPSKFQVIKDKLRAKGIDCQVIVKFDKYKFRTANNSAALFHNIRFDKLLSEVAYKKDYEFDKRFILTILVTETLKLTKILTKGDFDSLSGWMDAEYPNEKLTLFEWTDGDSQFFIKTESKLSTLFVYFVLSQFKEKSAFKYPKNYQKKTPEERSNLMKILYERIGKNIK